MDRQQFKKKRIMKPRKRRILFFILIPILFLSLSGVGYGTYLYKQAKDTLSDSYKKIDGRDKSDKRTDMVNPEDDHVSILVMGVDDSDKRDYGTAIRTDALLLATLNKEDKSIKLVSIPRDTYTYIPEVGYDDKINHAHVFGGEKATIETVEELFDIPVDYYVKVNFYAFIDLVDALGGITVDVPYEFYEQDSKDKSDAIHLYPGEQTLDGEEALALARTRKLDSDVERGKRQQEILKAIATKALSVDALTKYDELLSAIGDNMTTDLTFNNITSFWKYGTSGRLNIETLTLEGEDLYLNNSDGSRKYVYNLDPIALDETIATLKDHLEISNPTISNEDEEDEIEDETGI
ncbi:LCP family protein [Bacillus spongiae]|uniref:LCP family protein n=1 Tax=Bacillus spongiae TaxID=2683610 RepID=A0ABU8HE05_9BACI